MKALQDKKVVIIGGTSDMGLGAARSSVLAGAEVVIGGSNEERLRGAVEELGEQATGIRVDVMQTESLESFFAQIGTFEHLFFTAAPGSVGPFLDQPLDEARAYLDGHLWGSYTASKLAVPQLNSGGTITFLSGGYHKRPAPGRTMVVVAQAAVEGLMRALAVELSPIRVNAIVPGLIDTPLWHGMPKDQPQSYFEAEANRLPAKRIGQPSDIGDALVFLMTNGFVTGSAMEVDGGFHLV